MAEASDVEELPPLTDAEKLEMLSHFGIRFVPYKDSTGPRRWVIELAEGSILHKFDLQRMELITHAIFLACGIPPELRYVHLPVPSHVLRKISENDRDALIQVKLDDDGVAVDLFDSADSSAASTWETYTEIGVTVTPLCP